MKRHAYLIVAHHQFELLKKNLVLLDDERNDFYIQVDKKAKGFKKQEMEAVLQKSSLFFTKRRNVNWGGFSGIEVEMNLLEAAIKGNYSYYHLLSGADLPIKSANQIYSFFEMHQGKEFIQFEEQEFSNKYRERVCFYHFFREKQASSFILRKLHLFSMHIQTKIKIDRTKDLSLIFQKGANWFSITNEFAHYVVNKKGEIERVFRNTSCADEIFLQTLLVNSPFKQDLYHQEFDNDCDAIKRFIDWKRGTPYVFHLNDFEELIQSDYLFARKFDLEEDEQIVQKIFDNLMKKKD